ncbi:MAG TPA: tetratricopeptide repeat protein [Methylomirabilota bacterium]|jgi:tetratricopeptide (TPR) repeat protein
MRHACRAPASTFTIVLCSVLVSALLLLVPPPPASADGAGGTPRTPSKPVDPDYTKAVASIKAGDFATAIPLLEGVVARDETNADAYNWLAYSVRKSGDPARSIPIYQKALAIDPKHKGAHEYIGEAYLVLGDLPRAKEHLAKLDGICFLPCSEYRDLKKAVEAYEKSAGKVKPTAGR